MINWFKVKDFAQVITGGTPSTQKKEYWEDGNIPWLNSGELNQDIIIKSSNFISKLGLEKSAARLMPPDTILIALTGATTGKIGYLTFEACANQSVTGILPSTNHHPKYLYFYLSSIRKRILNDAYGGAQPHISQKYVKELKIPLPPLETQKKIAAILDAADAYRQKTKALIEKYDELAQSLFLEMFGDISKCIKFPIAKLGNLLLEVKDGPHVSPRYSEKGIPILSTRNIRPFELILNEIKFVSQETYKEITKNFKPQKGDILLTKGGTTGYAKVVDWDWDFCIWVHLAALRPNTKLVNSEFIEAALNSYFCYRQSQEFTRGIANRDLGLTRLINIKIPLPPLITQLKFIQRLQLIKTQKAQAQEAKEKSDELFNSLLQKAFNGTLLK